MIGDKRGRWKCLCWSDSKNLGFQSGARAFGKANLKSSRVNWGMPDYRDSILRHEKEVNRLHGAIHETVKHREKSPSLLEKWIRAADEYRSHRSSIDDWLEHIRTSDISNWADAREFIFQYLEIDPVYNNSGYAKEMMVQKIKKCDLSEKENRFSDPSYWDA